jgi:hypothetical protein
MCVVAVRETQLATRIEVLVAEFHDLHSQIAKSQRYQSGNPANPVMQPIRQSGFNNCNQSGNPVIR